MYKIDLLMTANREELTMEKAMDMNSKKKLGFGLMRLPKKDGKIDHDAVCKLVDLFLERGFTYFDTAYVYDNGNSEIAARECIVKRHPRDSFTIATKYPTMGIPEGTEPVSLFNTSLERLGVDALVLSAGFVSKAPMAVMRGAMPLKAMAHYMDMRKFWWLKVGLSVAGRLMVPTVPYSDLYLLDTARLFRQALKLPLIYVGGVTSAEGMQRVLDEGFVAFQMARALVRDPAFMEKIRSLGQTCSPCGHSNYCIARMYTLDMRCHSCVENLPRKLQKEVEINERHQRL